MSRFLSPLRYPGGKGKLAINVANLILNNNLSKLSYIEPFCGGAGVALYLLFNEIVEEIHINDFDSSIYAFWYSVLNYNSELCDLINNAKLDMEEWYLQKEIQENKNTDDLLSLGFSTFYLNRTNRSGIMSAGVMGGYEQTGKYKIDCRFNKKDLVKRIKKIYEYREKIHLYNLNTIDFIEDFDVITNNTKFIYFDPPYYKQGSNLYVNFYKHDDHLELSERIKKIKDDYWIITYDNVEAIKCMYSELEYDHYTLSYTLEKKYDGKEIIIYSNNIKIKSIDSNPKEVLEG